MNFLELIDLKKKMGESGFTRFTSEEWALFERSRGVDLLEELKKEIVRLRVKVAANECGRGSCGGEQ